MTPKGIFRSTPSKELIEEILTILQLNTNKIFTKYDINGEKFEEVITWIEPYYIPCKAKRFLYDIDDKKYITVLRHILRTNNYDVKSSEKLINGIKTTTYQIISINQYADLSGSFIMSFQ